jgi:hypothetical protein
MICMEELITLGYNVQRAVTFYQSRVETSGKNLSIEWELP